MRFYTTPHQFYGGIDLHARTMYLCVLNQAGESLLHRHMKAAPEPLLKAIAPYREDLVLCVEGLFTWYWLADLCACEDIPFVLGHALYMKAIHGGKAYRKWAFSEAAVLFWRNNPAGQKSLARIERKHGKGQALTILAHKLARAVYDMLTRDTAFDLDTFLREEWRGAGEPAVSRDADGLSLARPCSEGEHAASSNAHEHIGLSPGSLRVDWTLVPAPPILTIAEHDGRVLLLLRT
jgi:hypothetical protein